MDSHFAIWLAANFLFADTASWLTGSWYPGWETPPANRMLVEMGLVMLPNLILPVAALRYGWLAPIRSLRHSLGWVWNGWRSVVVGAGAFLLAIVCMAAVESLVGENIPYTLPGSENTIQAHITFFCYLTSTCYNQ